MLYLKGCPRCHGDLYLDRDAHGAFRQCLQCGWIQDLQEKVLQLSTIPVVAKRPAATSASPGRKAIA
ncbi:MAG: hypothetical protein HW397_275 [Dehalococcoidia bacterium]|nr:hypothetical protein [Dehalococcoidia bacterium]